MTAVVDDPVIVICGASLRSNLATSRMAEPRNSLIEIESFEHGARLFVEAQEPKPFAQARHRDPLGLNPLGQRGRKTLGENMNFVPRGHQRFRQPADVGFGPAAAGVKMFNDKADFQGRFSCNAGIRAADFSPGGAGGLHEVPAWHEGLVFPPAVPGAYFKIITVLRFSM